MALLAMAFPIAPGKTEQWQKFASELMGARRADFAASRKCLGIRERTFLQKTPMGDMIVVTLEGKDPASAFQRFSEGNDEFTKWFLTQVSAVHGIDLTKPPPGPPPQLVIDSEA